MYSYTAARKAREQAMKRARNAQFYFVANGNPQWKNTLRNAVSEARSANRICVARRKEWRYN